MPQIKALLGHVMVETAKKKRSCSRHKTGAHKHDIVKDEICLVVQTPDGNRRNYCIASASEILDRAEVDLRHLRSEMGL